MKYVTIFGGSGFIGRYITRRFAAQGWRVRVAIRHPNEALFVRTYGEVGQVEPIQANLRDEASVKRAITGAELVINVAGVTREKGKQSFEAINVEGAELIAKVAKAASVSKLVHITRLGASEKSHSKQLQSFAKGEIAVQKVFPDSLIIRSDRAFGIEDNFLNKLGRALQFFPIFASIGSDLKSSPVYVDDIARFVYDASERNLSGLFELTGPKTFSERDLLDFVNKTTLRKRPIITLPGLTGRLTSSLWNLVETCTLGIIKSPFISPSELEILTENPEPKGDNGFKKLGIEPVSMELWAKRYLEAYRASGQFEELLHPLDNNG